MKVMAINVVFLAAFSCMAMGHARAGSSDEPKGSVTAHHRTAVRTELKHTEAKHVFSGRVEQVDVAARTFSVSDRGNRIGFDASNPIFTGYRSLSDMEIGDRVAAFYTTHGIRVTKLSAGGPSGRKGEVRAEEEAAAGLLGEKPSRPARRLIKMAKQRDQAGFDEADIKKDGKITPVGLSVVIKDITMDEFSKYDKNHHGYLNKAEFLDAVKHLKTGGR